MTTSTAAPSTGQDDDDRARLLASTPDLLRRTNADLDELDRRRAADAAKAAADARKAAAMRAAKTAWIDAHIEDVIRNKKRALVAKPRCGWTSILLKHYERNGIKAPDIETVRRVVYDFSGF